jgi:hypothetical protein
MRWSLKELTGNAKCDTLEGTYEALRLIQIEQSYLFSQFLGPSLGVGNVLPVASMVEIFILLKILIVLRNQELVNSQETRASCVYERPRAVDTRVLRRGSFSS